MHVRLSSVLAWIMVLACTLPGCTLYRTIPLQQDLAERACRPRSDPFATLVPEGIDRSVPPLPKDVNMEMFSDDVRRISAAIGVLPLLKRLVYLEERVATHEALHDQPQLDVLVAQNQLMTVHHRLLSRVVLASLEVERVTSAIRCEYARTREMWDVAQMAQDRRSSMETAVAVIVAGLGATAAGAFTLVDMATGAGVSQAVGGTLGAILGSGALVEQVGHEVDYPPNILVEVWDGPEEPAHLPRAIWRLLTDPREENHSLRDMILAEWKHGMEELGEKEGKDPRDLLFAKGVTGLDALRVRTTMLEVLSTNMDLIQQDIEMLLRTLILREPMIAAM